MANNVDPDQTAPIGAVCSGSTLFASILNLSVMLGNCLQQTTSADDIFRCILSWPLRVNMVCGVRFALIPTCMAGLHNKICNKSPGVVSSIPARPYTL